MIRLLMVPVLLLVQESALAGATPIAAKPDDISNLIEHVRRLKPVPGMVAAVVRGDDIIAIGASGVRKRGADAKVTIDDQFHLGSCTKAMTATLCGMLVEDGKLKWDSTLAEIFPELAPKMKSDYAKVTLAQLLTHHAGVPANVDVGAWYAKVADPSLDVVKGREMVLEAVVTHDPIGAPGEKYEYANAGFVIAGHMAEKVTGKSWEQLMRERLFDPLGMKSVGFGAPGTVGKLDEPRGHGLVGLPVEPVPGADNPRAMGPAGTAYCTIGDWAKFISLHLMAERGQPKLLKAETFKKLHTPVMAKREGELDYAMGWCWAERGWAGGMVLNHAGSNSFWLCETWVAPKKNFAVLVMCNQGPPLATGAVDEITLELIKRYCKD